MRMIPLHNLVGHDAEIDPAFIQFKAIPAKVHVKDGDENQDRACASCYFKGQKSKICVKAGQLARMSGFQDCEDRDSVTGKTFIYVLVQSDPRQLSIE